MGIIPMLVRSLIEWVVVDITARRVLFKNLDNYQTQKMKESFEFWQDVINQRLATQEAVIHSLKIRKESLEKNLDKFKKEHLKVNSILEKFNE